MKTKIVHNLGITCVALCLTSACSLHHVDETASRLELQMPASYAEYRTGASLPGDWTRPWWESFKDEVLNRLVEEGLANNFSIIEFAARMEQASALARQAGARLYPSLDASAGYDAEWDDQVSVGSAEDREERSNVGLTLRWEADIWQRLANTRRAEVQAYEASVEDWLGARLLLSSAIAQTYFEIKEQRRQLEVIQAQLEINESLQKLTSLRFGQGQSSIVAVLQQQEQLEETQARVPQAEARIGQLEYSLDVLLGRTTDQQKRVMSSQLDGPPALPEVGIPSQLLTRRPDLRAAQKRVLALDYDVGTAVANQLPAVVLGASMDWRGNPDLGDEITTIFARLTAPLFRAGELKTEVQFRKARLDAALAGYADLYLSALAEVESALLEERKAAERLVLVEKQLRTSQRLLTESRNRFSQGLTDYLPVFTSLNIVQSLERDVVVARRSVLSARVNLHRALGGPIDSPDPSSVVTLFHE